MLDLGLTAFLFFTIALFAHAGLSKLNPQNNAFYQDVVRGYELEESLFGSTLLADLAEQYRPWLVKFIGAAELFTAILLAVSFTRATGILIACLLLMMYALLFFQQVRYGKATQDCGCAGPNANLKVDHLLIIRNIVITLLLLAYLTVSPSLVELNFNYVITLVGMTLMTILFYTTFNQWVANRQIIKAIQSN